MNNQLLESLNSKQKKEVQLAIKDNVICAHCRQQVLGRIYVLNSDVAQLVPKEYQIPSPKETLCQECFEDSGIEEPKMYPYNVVSSYQALQLLIQH